MMVAVEEPIVETFIFDRIGAVLVLALNMNDRVFEARVGVDEAVDVAAPAFTFTVVVPDDVGWRLKVKFAPPPAKVSTVAFVVDTELELRENPLTGSEKVTVIGMLASDVVDASVEVSVTVGSPTANAGATWIAPSAARASATSAPIGITRTRFRIIIGVCLKLW